MGKLEEKVGKKFHRLTVLEYLKEYQGKKRYYKCECECGNIVYIRYNSLGQTKSCGCARKCSQLIDLTNKVFGKLTVISFDTEQKKWLCHCECGNDIYLPSRYLNCRNVRSCGCDNKTFRYKNIKHDATYKRLHTIWGGMHSRCYCKGNENYKRYGGKGIKICDEWNDNFIPFYEWSLNNGFTIEDKTLQIDRIDSNKDYCPDNCRWITASENSRRVSKTNLKLDELTEKMNDLTEDEIVREFYKRKVDELLDTKTKYTGNFFYRKPNYCILKGYEKRFLFRNHKNCALFLDISPNSLSYRMNHKNGEIAEGWVLENIDKETFDNFRNNGVEYIT